MEICPITGRKTNDYYEGISISYYVIVDDEKHFFDFCKRCFEKIDFLKFRSVIWGLILNKKILPNFYTLHWEESSGENTQDVKKIIEESSFPKTPKEKLDNLLIQLSKIQPRIGRAIELSDDSVFLFYSKCYFDNFEEFYRYLDALKSRNLIKIFKSFDYNLGITITFDGFDYLVDLENVGSESKNCFIAMAFKPETEKVRIAIKNAINKTGFNSIIIDEENIESDRTINDAIIAGIKNCKFCVSDFSYHRNGVYFESGFALGLGKPVIYCCSKEEFSKAHFDIKPLQHIIYENVEELEKKLIDKIEAWIK